MLEIKLNTLNKFDLLFIIIPPICYGYNSSITFCYYNYNINEYSENLYRRDGFFTYRDNDGFFDAEIAAIESDGCLKLKTRTGEIRAYYFKEVAFVQNA